MIDVVGGVYSEVCLQPEWDQLYGSAGRAAHALSGVSSGVRLHTCIDDANRAQLEALAASFGAAVSAARIERTIAFHYVHPLSVPIIVPPPHLIRTPTRLNVRADVILRFGMLEGDAIVAADRVVYDPQSAYDPRPFAENGSSAKTLAIVANGYELRMMTQIDDPLAGAQELLRLERAEVVVVKQGGRGALVVTTRSQDHVPAYRSTSVFSIGSGDIFAAAFAHFWGEQELAPVEAANLASRATARYCETKDARLVPRPEFENDWTEPVTMRDGCAYLAGPFFNIAERWLVEEARAHLRSMGLRVFSPLHDVGRGPGDIVAAKDLAGLDHCDRVLALVDTRDPGTLFEVGYARAKNLPVVFLAETLSNEEQKMLVGTNCRRTDDFATALYMTAWS
ncbi:MAG: PfkB family carbohydrate kinase [Kofleriaceae bacterium]